MSAGKPVFGLSFDPRALGDLLAAPGDIRDLALAQLQDIVNAQSSGTKLTGDLSGYRKLLVDARREWRIVYAQRPAPATSRHATEIHVIAVRPRARNDIYDTTAARLGMNRRPLSARTHAARSRSPQLIPQRPLPHPGPASHVASGPAQPAPTPSKGRTR
ncbi:hypothetical protein [Streptomyces pinistramenti]|uniref:hypothetical protein n=1 Tax=Streptomyces pinistramenti TaxID=2884812 RepID=UPI001D080E02|nr:hypothetical protein [Streptomyces pinistramenti]MCB5905857.1 hypothetical protein [Streptomyces pinistramenti]